MIKFEGTNFEKTFQIKELIDGKYTFRFKLVGDQPNKFTRLESSASESVAIIKFRQQYTNLYIDQYTNNGLEDNVVGWLICYSMDVLTNHNVIKSSATVHVSPELERELRKFGIEDHGRVSQIQDTCTAPPLSYPLVFDPGDVKLDLKGLQRRKSPVRIIGTPTMYIPLPSFTTSSYRTTIEIEDLYLNEWFIGRRTVEFSNPRATGGDPIFIKMDAELVPIVSKWDPTELKQLLVLFRKDNGTNRFGNLELGFDVGSNVLLLETFYNFSTKYLTLVQQNQFHRERWRGVMKKLLCACVRFFLDGFNKHATDSTIIELWPQPYFRNDLDNPNDKQGLEDLYFKSFGFKYPSASARKMQATVATVLSHCTEQLNEFEDGSLSLKQTTLKRKREPSFAEPLTL